MTGTGKRDRNDGRRPLGNRVTRPEPCKCEWTERTGPYRVPTPGNALCQTPGQTTQDTRTHRHLRNLLQSFDLMLGAQRTTLASGLPWAVAKQAGGRGIPMSRLLTVVRWIDAAP
jgi:hypothetical protein